jgi:hypothetical protein
MLRTLFSYESVPDLPRRVVDMANADYQKHHRGRKSWDINFCNAVAEYFDFIIEDGKKGTYWFKKR